MVKDFKLRAISSGVSQKVVEDVLSDAKFLPKVIEYDRYQPEFYEDTFTYIKKDLQKKKIKDGIKLYKKEKVLLIKLKINLKLKKNYYLALMGIETNFGKYLGKMDIIIFIVNFEF